LFRYLISLLNMAFLIVMSPSLKSPNLRAIP
jgi:hypothetical protein